MAIEIKCTHCGGPANKNTCDNCGEYALPLQEILTAQEKARGLIFRMGKNPDNCQTYEEAIGDDMMLFALGWEGTRNLILALNRIHIDHDTVSAHGSSLHL